MLGAAGDDGQLGQVIAQMTSFSEGLTDIRSALDKGVTHLTAEKGPDALETATIEQIGVAVAELSSFNKTLTEMKSIMAYGGIAGMGGGEAGTSAPAEPQKIEVVNKVPAIFLKVMRDQFRVLQTWVDPIIKLSEVLPEADDLMNAMKTVSYTHLTLPTILLV